MINFNSACEVQVHRNACQLNRSPCFLFSLKYPGLQCGLGGTVETGSYIGATVENVTLELYWSCIAMYWSHTVDFWKRIPTESRQYLALGRAVWTQYSDISISNANSPIPTEYSAQQCNTLRCREISNFVGCQLCNYYWNLDVVRINEPM